MPFGSYGGGNNSESWMCKLLAFLFVGNCLFGLWVTAYSVFKFLMIRLACVVNLTPLKHSSGHTTRSDRGTSVLQFSCTSKTLLSFDVSIYTFFKRNNYATYLFF